MDYGTRIQVGANQAVTVDPSRLHGLVNTGEVPLKYIDIGGIAVSPDGQWLVLSIKQEDLTLDLFRLSFP